MPRSVFLPPNQTRLVTIAAHVDHGKTTLADNLVEHNGLISERLAGTLRYLDADPEEQRRGITMRTSAIGLQHSFQGRNQSPTPMIIHLMDSPGHTDFSWEVSSSMSACDGVILVIDAVEGMGPRTHQVFREAYTNQLIPILVINKVDRLYTDLHLSTTEAYLRLQRLLETINAAAAAMLTSAQFTDEEIEATDEEQAWWTFEPAKGNVVFGSALFGWGFTVPTLSRCLFKNQVLPIKPMILKQCLFSDAKYKDGKILKWKHNSNNSSNEQPLFAEYALQPLWDIYTGVQTAAESSTEKITVDTIGMQQVWDAIKQGATIGNTSQLPASSQDWKPIFSRAGSNTAESVLRAVLRRYRPLSESILDTLCEYGVSPEQAPSKRTAAIKLKDCTRTNDGEEATAEHARGGNVEELHKLVNAVAKCDTTHDSPTVAHVYKFVATERSQIRDPNLPKDDESKHILLGVARVLCGELKTGSDYFCFGPKHQFGDIAPSKQIRLYLLMGSSLVAVDKVPAGHVCAIFNLDDLQLKTVTLSDNANAMPLASIERGIRPLVKVNVEAENASDTEILENGLVKLGLSDAAVEITATEKGERLLACLGEIHLEQAIMDLKQVYCSQEIEIRISDPIIDFGETTAWYENEQDYTAFVTSNEVQSSRQSRIPPYNEEEGLSNAKCGRSRSMLTGRSAAIRLRAVPLFENVYTSLKLGKVVSESEADIITLAKSIGIMDHDSKSSAEDVLPMIIQSVLHIDNNGNALGLGVGVKNKMCLVGVKSKSDELYIPPATMTTTTEEDEKEETPLSDAERDYERAQKALADCTSSANGDVDDTKEYDAVAAKIFDRSVTSIIAGFQLAVRSGPICEEPVRNVMIVVEGFEVVLINKSNDDDTIVLEPVKAVSSGTILSAMKSGVRGCLLTRPFRLLESHLKLTLHSTLAGLGALYNVLSKRRGKVLDDSMVDGTDLLMITASIPQAESFGLAPELLAKTSGEVTAPELVFSHWEMLQPDVDPFWIPTSLEEREDFGELQNAGDVSTGVDNTALKYVRRVRQQKGLVMDSSRTVVNAEKQRTLKR